MSSKNVKKPKIAFGSDEFLAVLLPTIWTGISVFIPYPLLTTTFTAPTRMIALTLSIAGLEIPLLLSLDHHFLSTKSPESPIRVHEIGVFVLLSAPFAYLYAGNLYSDLLDPLGMLGLGVWFEITYMVSILWTFRMYSRMLGMDYSVVWSPLVARDLAKRAVDRSQEGHSIDAHSDLAKAYENIGSWLHARGFQSDVVDQMWNALSATLGLHPVLSKRTVAKLGSALLNLPDWSVTTRNLKQMKTPADLVWADVLLSKTGRGSRRLFNAISVLATLLGAIGPIVYTIFQAQVARTVESSVAKALLAFPFMFFFATCLWLWKRVWATLAYGPMSWISLKLAIAAKKEREMRKSGS
jgi:hypothetical protein